MIRIELHPGAPTAPGQACLLRVRIHNPGPAVELDNPAALMAGPRWRLQRLPDGPARLFDNTINPGPPETQPPRLRLDPGATWQATVPLELPDDGTGPGQHGLTLLLQTPEGLCESEPCLLLVLDWQIVAADAGHGVQHSGKGAGDTLLLQAGAGGRLLYRMPWKESHSDRQGHGGSMPILLADVGAEAGDLRVPVQDGPFWGDPARWLLWREGATVHALDTCLQRQSLALDTAPAALLRPALQRAGGPVEVFALTADRRRLDLLRFARQAGGAAQVVQQINLPWPATAAMAAFAPEGGLLVAVSAAEAGDVLLMLHRAGAAQLARMAQAVLLHACPPALRVLEDGQALVAAAVQTEAGIAIAVARFDAAGGAVMESTALGPISGRVVEGALLLAPAHAHADGVHAAGFHLLLRLEDGSLLRLDEQGSLTPTTFEAPPVTPLTMELGSHGAYVLACDPRLGPFMAEA